MADVGIPPWPDLADLMARARRERLWFWCNYQDLWFSPDELQAEWDKGSFRWGAVNWKLRDPVEYLQGIHDQIRAREDEIVRLKARLAKGEISHG